MEKIVRIFILAILMACNSAIATTNILKIPLHGSNIIFNTSKLQDISSLWVSRQVDCQLLRMKDGSFYLDAAKKVHYISPTRLDIVLKDNVRFSDGSKLKAKDVVASFSYLKKHSTIQSHVFHWIKKIKIISNHEIIIVLNHPVPQFLTTLSAPYFSIFKKSFLRLASINSYLWNKPVTCGGYAVEQNKNRRIKLRPKSNKSIPIIFYLKPKSQISVQNMSTYDIVSLEVVGDRSKLKGYKVNNIFDPFQYYFAINTRLPPWNSRKARCSLLARLNPKIPMKDYHSEVLPAKDLIPSGTIGYSDNSIFMSKIYAQSRKLTLPKVKNRCVSFVSTSIEKSYRKSYIDMVNKVYPRTNEKTITNCFDMGKVISNEQCIGTFLAVKSHTHDAYEYLEALAGHGPSITGYKNTALAKRIESTQSIFNLDNRVAAYRKIIKNVINQCLLMPLFTMPYDKIYIKNNISAPGIGETAINNYYLGNVRYKN